MHIPIDRHSATPLYRQIEEYLRQSILAGALVPQTRLPASRSLAHSLGVNRITVEAAYAALEADGLVYAQPGSGTYALPPAQLHPLPSSDPACPWPLWQHMLPALPADSNVYLAESGLPTGISAGMINMASGIGADQLFPVDDFRKILQTVIRRDGASALDYGDRQGYLPLRRTITHVLASQGLNVSPDNILITSGSQQGLALAAQLLLRPGDVVLVEDPTYRGALDIFRRQGAHIVGIALDERGMQVERLENLLQQYHARLIYTIPNFHNPTGVSLEAARRRQLLALADRYNAPVLEDDFVGDLRYEGRALPALKSLDPGGRVIYTGTFSKMVMPGIRVGFLAAEGPVYHDLLQLKYMVDLATPSLIQRALEAYVTIGRYQAHLRRSIHIYRKRRNALLQAIVRWLPAGVQVASPQGGLFAWLRLPDGMYATRLLELARQEGVTFAPGAWFFIDPQHGEAYIRLNFTVLPPEGIEEGIRRLGRAIQRYS